MFPAMTDAVGQRFLCFISEERREVVVDTNQYSCFENTNVLR